MPLRVDDDDYGHLETAALLAVRSTVGRVYLAQLSSRWITGWPPALTPHPSITDVTARCCRCSSCSSSRDRIFALSPENYRHRHLPLSQEVRVSAWYYRVTCCLRLLLGLLGLRLGLLWLGSGLGDGVGVWGSVGLLRTKLVLGYGFMVRRQISSGGGNFAAAAAACSWREMPACDSTDRMMFVRVRLS